MRMAPSLSPRPEAEEVRVENGATLYSGGRVLALDGVTPPQEALVVRDGRVAGVGDAGDMTRLAGKGARRVLVRGATIMPGLIDTHPHLLHFGAFTEPLVDLSDARDHDEIVARIRRRAAETPAGRWIMTTRSASHTTSCRARGGTSWKAPSPGRPSPAGRPPTPPAQAAAGAAVFPDVGRQAGRAGCPRAGRSATARPGTSAASAFGPPSSTSSPRPPPGPRPPRSNRSATARSGS